MAPPGAVWTATARLPEEIGRPDELDIDGLALM
jgi:hypothetical protein